MIPRVASLPFRTSWSRWLDSGMVILFVRTIVSEITSCARHGYFHRGEPVKNQSRDASDSLRQTNLRRTKIWLRNPADNAATSERAGPAPGGASAPFPETTVSGRLAPDRRRPPAWRLASLPPAAAFGRRCASVAAGRHARFAVPLSDSFKEMFRFALIGHAAALNGQTHRSYRSFRFFDSGTIYAQSQGPTAGSSAVLRPGPPRSPMIEECQSGARLERSHRLLR